MLYKFLVCVCVGVCVSSLICMCAAPLPFVPARSMRLPAIQALGNIFLLSDGILGVGGWGKDYPVHRDGGWQGGKRRVVGRQDGAEVQLVCVCALGGRVCV